MGQIIARAGQQIRNMEGGFRFRGLKDDGGNAAGLQHTQSRNGAGQGGGILVYRNRQHTAASALGIGDVPAPLVGHLEQRPAGSLGLAGVGFVASGVVAMGGFRAVFGIGRIIIVNVIAISTLFLLFNIQINLIWHKIQIIIFVRKNIYLRSFL